MRCYNVFCRYNEDNSCLLEIIEINSLGMCEECIIISIDKEFLDREKRLLLDKLDSLEV